MTSNDDFSLPVHLGDYPDGMYWSAEPPAEALEEEPPERLVSGRVIRVGWDYGVQIPLWDDEGLMPDDPEWLREALNLSDGLIRDLAQWCLEWDELDSDRRKRTQEAFDALKVRGGELALRLQEEIGSHYRVKYRP